VSGIQGEITFDTNALDFISFEKENSVQDFLLTNNKKDQTISFALAFRDREKHGRYDLGKSTISHETAEKDNDIFAKYKRF